MGFFLTIHTELETTGTQSEAFIPSIAFCSAETAFPSFLA